MLRFIDGFDHYAIGDIFGKWTSGTTAAGATGIGTAVPARTGSCLYLGDSDWIHLGNPGGNQATLMLGFGFRYTAVNTGFIVVFGDQGTGAVNSQCGLRLNSGGTLSACRNNSTAANGMRPAYHDASGIVVLDTTAIALNVDEWNYLEVKVTIHNSLGAFRVTVNGVAALNLTGIDTQFQTAATASHVGLGGPYISGGGRHAFDDLYIADGAAGDVVDLLGPQRVATVIASPGNGTHVDWTPSTGTDHGANVDDATPNGDTDYNHSLTVGHRDSYHFAAVPLAGTVNGVQATAWAKISDAGARSINHFARISGATHDGTPAALDTTYRAVRYVWPSSPASSGAWTIPEIDAAEFGVRVQA